MENIKLCLDKYKTFESLNCNSKLQLRRLHDTHEYKQFEQEQQLLKMIYHNDIDYGLILQVITICFDRKILFHFQSSLSDYFHKQNYRRGISTSTWHLFEGLSTITKESSRDYHPRLSEVTHVMVELGMDFNINLVVGSYYYDQIGSCYIEKSPLSLLKSLGHGKFFPKMVKQLVNCGLTDFHMSRHYSYYNLIIDMVGTPKKYNHAYYTMELLLDFGLQFTNGMRTDQELGIEIPYSFRPSTKLKKRFKNVENYVLGCAQQPLSLQKQTRLTIRRSIGGIHFQEKVRSLRLPQSQMNFVIGL